MTSLALFLVNFVASNPLQTSWSSESKTHLNRDVVHSPRLTKIITSVSLKQLSIYVHFLRSVQNGSVELLVENYVEQKAFFRRRRLIPGKVTNIFSMIEFRTQVLLPISNTEKCHIVLNTCVRWYYNFYMRCIVAAENATGNMQEWTTYWKKYATRPHVLDEAKNFMTRACNVRAKGNS